jgi:hypothetical protein
LRVFSFNITVILIKKPLIMKKLELNGLQDLTVDEMRDLNGGCAGLVAFVALSFLFGLIIYEVYIKK